MAASTKIVYICLNNKFQTLYNKTLGTWNDGQKGRDNSSVWTFSAKHDWTESKTIQKAIDWLEKIGHKDITFELATVEVVNGKECLIPEELEALLIRQGIEPVKEPVEMLAITADAGKDVDNTPNEFLEMVFGPEYEVVLSDEPITIEEMDADNEVIDEMDVAV